MIITNGLVYYKRITFDQEGETFSFWFKCTSGGVLSNIPYNPQPFEGADCNYVWAVGDVLPTGFTQV